MADVMSPTTAGATGPALAETVSEVQAIFPSDAALQDAVGRLRVAGFDHADLSLPPARLEPATATPDQAAAPALGEDDSRQARTMNTSMAATAGAFLGAALTVATGGAAAVAVAAAAAGGAVAGGSAYGATSAAKQAEDEARAEAGRRGELVLAVRTPDDAARRRAETVLREAGAARIAAVTRENAALPGANSAGWTG
jgi:hypothetical protein